MIMNIFSNKWINSAICLIVLVVAGSVVYKKVFQKNKFVPTRVILSTNTNPMYFDFWPIAAKAWKKRIGLTPTLALICDEDVEVDESVGEVIRFKPIPGVPSGLYAQVVRLFLPVMYPDDICIIGDIDMIPISRSYYKDSVKNLSDDVFVVYRDKAYPADIPWWPTNYIAGKGSMFAEIFGLRSINDIPQLIKKWAAQGYGWHTDEILMTRCLRQWDAKTKKLVKLGETDILLEDGRRIDRGNWQYDVDKLVNEDYYIDCHSIRPYKDHKAEVDKLASYLGLEDTVAV